MSIHDGRQLNGEIAMRLYCHGLGDCLLLNLPTNDGRPFWMLIDCGIHSAVSSGPAIIDDVVKDIAALTGGHLDLIVGTHEHWDHISGFLTAKEAFARLNPGAVWLAWSENPDDADARQLDRFKADATATVRGLRMGVGDAPAVSGVAAGVDALMGFLFGAAGEKVRSAREALKSLGPVRYLEPGTIAPLPDRVKGVRIYVLGPPRDRALLSLSDESGAGYRMSVAGHPNAAPLSSALAVTEGRMSQTEDQASPFDSTQGVSWRKLVEGDWSETPRDLQRLLWNEYFHPRADDSRYPGARRRHRQDARRIDTAWLGGVTELALQLDNNTNNSSLVLAIELVESGRVLLFAADAQMGNWKSWAHREVAFTLPGNQRVTSRELLSRTIFYKVGHHGSGNATRAQGGLEAMSSTDLVAFNPTDESRASALRWRDFPSAQLNERLLQKTAGRYIRSDDPCFARGERPAIPRGGALREMEVVRKGSIDLLVG